MDSVLHKIRDVLVPFQDIKAILGADEVDIRQDIGRFFIELREHVLELQNQTSNLVAAENLFVKVGMGHDAVHVEGDFQSQCDRVGAWLTVRQWCELWANGKQGLEVAGSSRAISETGNALQAIALVGDHVNRSIVDAPQEFLGPVVLLGINLEGDRSTSPNSESQNSLRGVDVTSLQETPSTLDEILR